MAQNINKLLQSLAIALLGLAATIPAQAELIKSSADNYEIASEADYEEFRQLVATGNPYANAVLTSDITVHDVIGRGDVQFHYRGTFDGQGYTITLDSLINDTQNQPWGLFQYTEPGCVIRNLMVDGYAESQYEFLGSVVGQARGTRIENCISTVDLKTINGTAPNVTPGGIAGGLIGAGYGVNFVENCAFLGSIYSSEAYGIAGYVKNNIEIKSCYVDATFSNPDNSKQILKKTDDGQILLNNYYHQRGDTAPADESGATEVSDVELTNGKLCFNLNVKGRRGLVWYQHSDRPYLFKGTDGQVASLSPNGNVVVASGCANHRPSYGFCPNCGNIESGQMVAPLQISYGDVDDLRINNYRFKLNDNLNPKTAEFLGLCKETPHSDITAVHIPETIIVEGFIGYGEEYIVDYVKTDALKNSNLEYLYISKNANHIDNNALSGCTSLKYLHIADRPDDDVNQRLLIEYNGDKGYFKDCPLETVYIGRHLKWRTSEPAPFYNHATIKNVFWGPRVKRVGNYYAPADPRDGNCEAFDGCSVNNIYFMGDEKTLNQDDVEVWMRNGLREAKNFYVNRTIKITDDIDNYTTYSESGIFKSCDNVSFGPFVKYIGADLFGASKAFYNRTLTQVDFINANRLEKINAEAFYECPDAVFTGLWGQYPLKNIGDYAFYNCDKLEYINFGTQLESIGMHALEDCEVLNFISIPGTVTTIGDDAFDDCPRLQGVSFEAGSISLPFEQLKGRFDGTENIASLYLNRNFAGVPEDPSIVGEDSPFDASDGCLTSLTIGPNVSTLWRGLFYGLNAISSVSFEYSDIPLAFDRNPGWVFDCGESGKGINNNPISSLRIDRNLFNYHKDSATRFTHVKGSDWGASQQLIRDITFGEHITDIYASSFEGFTGLQTLLFSPSVETIEEYAFKNAYSPEKNTKGLSSVIFTGPTVISSNAFYGCRDLETIVVCDPGLVVQADAFANCNNIKEITVASDGNTAEGSDIGFSREVYQNAILYSPYDTSAEAVAFSQNPWKQFENHPNKRTNDYMAESGQAASGVYEHASIKVDIDKGNYEIFYAPFAWDSYYFGADAEVYTLSVNDDCYEEVATHSGEFATYDIRMQRVDLLNNHILPKGVYLVQTDYSAKTLSATRNLFVEYEGIEVDNTRNQTIRSASNNAFAFGGLGGDLSDASFYVYVIEDGVIKKLNGHHNVKNGSALLVSGEPGNEHYETFNIMDNDTNLLTSKLSVSFHELLEGYATFYSAKHNVCAPNWCEVYVVTNVSEGSVSLEKVTDRIINAGQAVILKTKREAAIGADDLMIYVVNGSSATDLYEQNLLRGVGTDTPVSEISGDEGFVYVLSCNSQHTNTGFYKFSNGKTLGAGKAYLLPSDFGSAARTCLFSFGDVLGGSGISNVDAAGSTGVAYDLTGRRIDMNKSDVKGIRIIDHKKVIK